MSCRQDKRNRIDRLCEEMDEASRNRDGKKVWECARAVAGTGLGLKRRVFQPPDEVPITAREWDEYMKDTFCAQLSSPLGPRPSKGCVLGQLPPMHEFFNTIEYSKNNKTVADGDVPSEVWKLIIRDQSAAQIIYELFQQSLREGVNPAAFCTSPLAPIDKGNNKKGETNQHMQFTWQAIPQNTIQTSRQGSRTTVEFWKRQGSKERRSMLDC